MPLPALEHNRAELEQGSCDVLVPFSDAEEHTSTAQLFVCPWPPRNLATSSSVAAVATLAPPDRWLLTEGDSTESKTSSSASARHAQYLTGSISVLLYLFLSVRRSDRGARDLPQTETTLRMQMRKIPRAITLHAKSEGLTIPHIYSTTILPHLAHYSRAVKT